MSFLRPGIVRKTSALLARRRVPAPAFPPLTLRRRLRLSLCETQFRKCRRRGVAKRNRQGRTQGGLSHETTGLRACARRSGGAACRCAGDDGRVAVTAVLERLRRRLRRLQPGGRHRQRAAGRAASACACCRARTTSRAHCRCARARCSSRPTASAAASWRRKACSSSAPRNGARSRSAVLLATMRRDQLLTVGAAKDAGVEDHRRPEGQARRLGHRRAVAEPEHQAISPSPT